MISLEVNFRIVSILLISFMNSGYFFLVMHLADYKVSIVRAKKLRKKIHASQQSPIDAEWFIHPLRFYDAHVPRQLIQQNIKTATFYL